MDKTIIILLYSSYGTTWCVEGASGAFPRPDLQYVPFIDEDGGTGGITILNGVTVHNRASVFSPNKTEVELVCTADYPIRWNITGYLVPPEYVKIQPYRREQFNKTMVIYSLKLIIFFTPDETETEVGSSSLVSCLRVDHSSIKSSLAIFVPGSKPLVASGEMTKLQDVSLIPCATTNPTIPTFLYKKSANGRMFLTSGATYDPLYGFKFPDIVQGQFTCIAASDSAFYDIQITQSQTQGFDYSPKKKNLKAFTNQVLLLTCSSTDKRQKVTIKPDMNNLTLEWVVSADNNSVAVKVTSPTSTSGVIQCTESSRSIWNWEYTFLDPPELYLDNFEGEVDCLSSEGNTSVSTVRCRSPSECEFMKHCFTNASLCNFNRQKQFFSEKATRCWIEEKGGGADCTSVPYSHLNGIVQCTVQGLDRYWQFFVSLDFLRHYNWEIVAENELIRMEEVGDVLYTNNTATFFCVATSFLFADSIRFSIEYDDGTIELLDESLYKNPGKEDPRKIDEFNVLGELKINLTLRAVGIYCHAPWWNSTDSMTVQRRFKTKHLISPTIEPVQSKVTFIIGAMNQRLTCQGSGEPKLDYSWYINGKKIEEGSNLKVSTGSRGESILEFPLVEESEGGRYLCEANNSVGRASLEFNVLTEEEGVSTNTVVYGTTVGIILLILILVICVLAIVFRRYRKAKELLRGLTVEEIDEFFKGKPQFLDSYQKLNVDNLDFVPYESKYEINLNDIDFDTSNILGSGEFSYVVKGQIKPSRRDVAVKIAKTSADVTVFKSMLTEVKILIHIGEHENILALVGASTRNIKNRSIHIVLELCEAGSLENYLRKGRKDFSNLIDQNQMINLSLLEESVTMSTLDLIRWSHHISNGMEYLAFKSIVHADLAARNVLLNNKGVAKISDFGLSKKLYECNNYVKKTKSPLPWRWMALESLTTLSFSSDSDIWSLGVTLWEIFSLGDIPFPNESWDKDFINRLASGMRMGRPKFSTPQIYSKIVACWDDDAALRPPFANLRSFFHDLYGSFVSNEDYPKFTPKDPKVEVEGQPSVMDHLYSNFEGPLGGPDYANDLRDTPNYANMS